MSEQNEQPNVLEPQQPEQPPVTATEAVAAQEAEDQKRWGMPGAQAQQFFGLVYLGLERMSQRQRTMFRRATKAACRDLNALWPHGKPMDRIREEAERAAAEHAAKPQIIIPTNVNADALKEKK